MTRPDFKDDQFSKEMLEKLAARIKAFRKDRGYSNYEKFSNEVNINRVQYGRYEQGQNISFVTLVNLLRAMDVSLAEFFSEDFDYPKKDAV